MTRDELIDIVWGQVEPHVFITKEEYVKSLDGWKIEPVCDAHDRLCFITMNKGPAFHFVSLNTGTPITLALGRSWLEPILDREGYVTTRTPRDARRQQRFNEKVGFEPCGGDEFFVNYRMEKRCPQSV